MILAPDQKALLQRGEAYERLVTTDDWQVFVKDVQQKRDNWLALTSQNADRAYLSAQAFTANLLCKLPFDCIDSKNQLLATLQEQAELEKQAGQDEEKFTASRPAPQAV